MVLRAARIHTGNDAEAEDLAQETLLKAFKAIDDFRAGTHIKAWLLTIMRNTRIDRLRTAAGSAKYSSLEELVAEPAAVEGGEAHDVETWENPEAMLAAFADEVVIAALNEISEDLRWTLLLVDVEGLDQEEAAGLMEVPVGTVKSRLHRGRAALRASLRPHARALRFVTEQKP